MKPFLLEIAEYYVTSHPDELSNYCFIFPNKRSGVFFSRFLAEVAAACDKPLFHPEITTISDFIAEVSDSVEASRLEQLFILYHCYKKVVEQETPIDREPQVIDFNRFRYWGDVLLSDFTDVDKYMVNPTEIFHNIESLKEISADYLTPEQIDVITRYWGADKIPPQVSDFWHHVVHSRDNHNDSNPPDKRRSTTSFIRLWQVMNQLYEEFRAELRQRGLSYQGMMYRRALDVLRDTHPDELPYEKYVFIGFNVLSTVEENIFKVLRDKQRADFFWDYISPAFVDKQNRATAFLHKYVSEFPKPVDATDVGRPVTTFPQINIISVPSVIGQAKLIGEVIEKQYPSDSFVNADLMSTAIVLPDENLALPVIDALPSYIDEINVTMGFPLRNTSVASLIADIRVMQIKSRLYHGEMTFFHEDVRNVLSHPLVRSVSPTGVDALIEHLNINRLYNIPVSFFRSESLRPLLPLFSEIKSKESADNVFNYLERLCKWLLSHVITHYSVSTPDDSMESDDEETPVKLSAAGAIEVGFIKKYLLSINELKRLRQEHSDDLNVDLEEGTIFGLVERLMSSEEVRFEGMPLKGLQVIGILETRALDFDNIVIPSMNERIFPRRHFSRSMIPPALRVAYGMATIDHQESISAYYFYRLISRARNVTLLFDSRTSSLSSGEPSRYINQLRYLYNPDGITFNTASYNMITRENDAIAIKLTPRHREKLRLISTPGSGVTLSASSVNKFVNCPVSFILGELEGYKEDNEVKDYFDEATYGTVVHEVLQNLYNSRRQGDLPLRVDRNMIELLDNDTIINQLIVRSINKNYYKLGDNNDTPLHGDALIMSQLILPQIRSLLRHELDGIQYFDFIGAEVKDSVLLKFPGGLSINFKYIIDRLDYVKFDDGRETFRIIDYKTGGDSVTATELDELFVEKGTKLRPKAILQLMLYANALAQRHPDISPAHPKIDETTPIMPQIFSFRTIAQGRAPEPLMISKQKVTDYHDFNEHFMNLMEEKLMELFGNIDGDDNDDVVYAAAESMQPCTYCVFKPLCGRE